MGLVFEQVLPPKLLPVHEAGGEERSLIVIDQGLVEGSANSLSHAAVHLALDGAAAMWCSQL